MTNVHYCFIARDSDMVVFEILLNSDLNLRQLQNEMTELLVAQERIPEGDIDFKVKVVFAPFKCRVWRDCHLEEQVAPRRAIGAFVAFAGDAEFLAVFHSGWDANFNTFADWLP